MRSRPLRTSARLHGFSCSGMTIELPGKWVDASALENALAVRGGAHEAPPGSEITFRFPFGCKVMIDAAVRMLSLLNQLDACTRRVVLEFEEGESGAMGYLGHRLLRLSLDERRVHPYRPAFSAADTFRGRNRGLVEITAIGPQARDQDLPNRRPPLSLTACGDRQDLELRRSAWLIFAELESINIYSQPNASRRLRSPSGLSARQWSQSGRF